MIGLIFTDATKFYRNRASGRKIEVIWGHKFKDSELSYGSFLNRFSEFSSCQQGLQNKREIIKRINKF